MPDGAAAALARMVVGAGSVIHTARTARGWTLRFLGDRAGVSAAQVHAMESGAPASLETYARVFTALGLRPDLAATDPRLGRQQRPR